MSTDSGKDVVYIDAEDEITTIIDKVGSSQHKIVALVLPKRSNVFQSVVNMKLLKRRAEHAGKHVVLITSEAGLLPLAGLSKLHVAPTLQSKPVVPAAPAHLANAEADAMDPVAETALSDEFDAAKAGDEPVGQLADNTPRVIMPAGQALHDENEAIELDNTTPAKPVAPAAAVPKSARAKHGDPISKPGGKGFKVPDFFRFRKRLVFIILGLIALVGLYILMFHVLPSAAVTIKTKTNDLDTNVSLTLDTTATQLDADKKTVPAKLAQQSKTYSQQTAATGQQNNGNKAGGQVTLTNCSTDGSTVTIPAGTGLSANGLTYITQSSATLQSSNFDFNRNCKSTGESSQTVSITAQQAGAQYNTSDTSFSVAGQGNVQARSNGDISGGTDQIVKIVQQSDIDAAKAKLNAASDQNAIKQQLQKSLQDDEYYAVTQSFTNNASAVSSSTPAGQPADNVTVTETIKYAMYGARKADLDSLVKSEASKQIDTSKQSILDDGVAGASYTVPNPGSGAQLPVTISATATAGPHLDVDSLATQLAGKKSGDVRTLLKSTPGVTDVQIHYSPFWVTSMPSNPNKINVMFQKDGSGSNGGN